MEWIIRGFLIGIGILILVLILRACGDEADAAVAMVRTALGW